MSKSKIVWHYTYNHIKDILKSRVLLPPALNPTYRDSFLESLMQTNPELAARMLDGKHRKGYESDKKLLLFSEREDWEPASYRGWSDGDGVVKPMMKVSEYDERGIRIWRIGVETKHLKPWARLTQIVRMPGWMSQSLSATQEWNVHQWWGTTVAVPASKWTAIQVRSPKDGQWHTVRVGIDGVDIITGEPLEENENSVTERVA